MRTLERVTIAGRVFCIAAVLGLVLTSRDDQAVLSGLVVAVVAVVAAYVSLYTLVPPLVVCTVEACVVGLLIGVAMPVGAVLLPYLVVLTLIAGVSRGVVGASAVTVAQTLTVGVLTLALPDAGGPTFWVESMAPWLVTSIVAGLIGSWLAESGRLAGAGGADQSYESARRLLAQLRTVTRRLSSGLDLSTMATETLRVVEDRLPFQHATLFTCTDGGLLTPLVFSDDLAREHLVADALVEECRSRTEAVGTVLAGDGTRLLALPLKVASRVVGVVLVRLQELPADQVITDLVRTLEEHSLRLDTALAFDEVRSIATAEERRRLAREIHDGIAQEIASLGYWVDDLRAGAESEEQRKQLSGLRDELTRVVSELRLSIFDLRSEVLTESGLGKALSDYVRQVGSRSRLTVHLKLDEAPARLRPETESELLRIAGEAITNARKHAGADNLWVECIVRPPFARLEVRDDGAGMCRAKWESYGLQIMKERASRIGANLEMIQETNDSLARGTTVRITLGATRASMASNEKDVLDDLPSRHISRVGR